MGRPDDSDNDGEKHPSRYRKELASFGSLTDLHGWQYFNGHSGLAHRCAWGLVIFSSAVAACVILTYAFLEYFKDAVETTYDPSLGTASELYFPTVTLCNVNQIRRSFVSELNLSDYQLSQVRNFKCARQTHQ